VTTFADVLARRIGDDPGRPLVTFYDLVTGERVELSVTTYANWVAKASSLLAEEHDLERGGTLRIDLPPHWLGPVFLGAAWSIGLAVSVEDGADAQPDAVVTGPEGLARWAPYADRLPVLACALLPMGVRYADPLAPGVHDVGVEVWSQPDSFTAWDRPGGEDAATNAVTQDELWSLAAAGSSLTDGGRLLAVANPASPSGLACFVEPLARSGSLVLVSVPDGPLDVSRLEEIAASERCTHRFLGLDQHD
jgi:uncharacterized protein (TIGR03089 family)